MSYSVESQIINTLSILILVLTLLMIGLRNLGHNLNSYAAHSMLLAVITGVVGYTEDDFHIYIAAIATVVIKVVIIPYIMIKLVSAMRAKREAGLLVKTPTSFIIAVGLTILASKIAHPLAGDQASFADVLTVSVAVSLIGMLLMVIRKDAVMQVVGLLIMENGLFLIGLILTHGMPFFVEIGIFFDILISGLLLWVYIKRMHLSLHSTNTAHLNQLRG